MAKCLDKTSLLIVTSMFLYCYVGPIVIWVLLGLVVVVIVVVEV